MTVLVGGRLPVQGRGFRRRPGQASAGSSLPAPATLLRLASQFRPISVRLAGRLTKSDDNRQLTRSPLCRSKGPGALACARAQFLSGLTVAVGCMPALATSVRRERVVHREATLARVYALPTFSARACSKLGVLRKASLFIWNASSALASDFSLLFRAH